jgi:hypothetical protein
MTSLTCTEPVRFSWNCICSRQRTQIAIALVTMMVITLAVIFSQVTVAPPAVVPASAPPAEFSAETSAGRPVVMTVVDQSDGLPETLAETYPPRPDDSMPQPWRLGRDPTFVRAVMKR